MNSPIKELINPLPGYTILHVSTHVDEMVTTLVEILLPVDGRLNLALYNVQEQPLLKGDVKVQMIGNFKEIFRALPRDNDIVIFHDIFSQHTQKERMLKSAYMTLANAGQIIIIEKKGAIATELLQEYLQKHEFRASNTIELFQDYDLIIAKKMHMWGNGL